MHVIQTGRQRIGEVGVVAINAIHLHHMPMFDYDKLLWGERQICSVANMTQKDARDFPTSAHSLNIRPEVRVFALEDANEALLAVKKRKGARIGCAGPLSTIAGAGAGYGTSNYFRK
jgi:propanol-preferring alcohol dehydrogenase